MPHPKETSRHFRPMNSIQEKAIADFKIANPGLPVRHEPIALDGEQGPWPCAWPGCMETALESAMLCSEHELLFIARAGKRSPIATHVQDWCDHLHDRGRWLLPHTRFK